MSKQINTYTCLSLDDFGKGIIKDNKNTFFVDNLLPGEKAQIETTFNYGKIKSAKVISLITKSKDRVIPKCKYFSLCGGCSLMHLDYKKQLEYKRNKVKNLIHKFTNIDIEVNDTIPSSDIYNFRNKIQKPLGVSKGNPYFGYYQESSHKLIKIDECIIESTLSNKICDTILKLIKKYKYTIYNEDTYIGNIRHILIKTSSFLKCLVTIVTKDENLKGRKEFAKELISYHPEIEGVVLNINKNKTNVILGQKEIPIYGKDFIKDKIFNYIFTISSSSFYQTNSSMVETLYRKAIELASLSKEDRVLDAYCGTGTIGISLSSKVKEVIGIENNPSAIKDAFFNKKRNNINNINFILDDATNYINSTDKTFDVIILDPPRKGTTKEFVFACKKIKPKKIIYISCDPVTLSRDLKYFLPEYKVEVVQPIDMFPHSYHVETVCLLTLKNQK